MCYASYQRQNSFGGSTGIDHEQIDRLSEGHKDCLRLVFRHMTSKEIGRFLDISPHTVDQRLKTAMRILDATSRVEAARMLAAHEAGTTYQPLIHQSPDIEDTDPAGSSLSPSHGEDVQADDRGYQLQEARASFDTTQVPSPINPLPPRPEGRDKHDLNAWQKLGLIAAIAIGAALSFGAVLAGLDALGRIS